MPLNLEAIDLCRQVLSFLVSEGCDASVLLDALVTKATALKRLLSPIKESCIKNFFDKINYGETILGIKFWYAIVLGTACFSV